MKTVTACILILLSIVLLFRCAKEVSCEEGCGGEGFQYPPLIPPIKIPKDTTDTVIKYNELISYYDFYIVDNSKVKKIYLNVQTKYIPGHYQMIDTIPVQQGQDGYYHGFFDIKSYKLGSGIGNLGRIFYDSCFQKNDTFRVFYEIRYRDATHLRTDTTTLIY